MPRLTEEAKEFIRENTDVSSRKLVNLIAIAFNEKYSNVAINDYKRKIKKARDLDLATIPTEPKHYQATAIDELVDEYATRPYPLSIDHVDRLLQANKDHYWYEYLNKMINKPGKLRADFEKLLVLIRDRA